MNQANEPRGISQLLILGSYTALVAALIAETLLMGWEVWALPLVVCGVAVCWFLHIRQKMTGRQRLWVYSAFMMASFFFYGIHVTSAYDMGLLIMIVMLMYTLTGEVALVTFCQAVYYVTLAYDLLVMGHSGTVWDSLLISRTLLHIVLIFMAGWLARFIIRQWEQLFRDSEERISSLDKTAKRMNAFLTNLSHELRTPVNAILGITEALHESETDPDRRKDCQTVLDAGRRMAEQISDIMDYSELETDTVIIHEEKYMLSSLFNDLLAELRPHVPEGLELVIDIDADTPAGLVSDPGKLRKILFHLICNSLKYTKDGGVYVRVAAKRQDYGVNLCIEITDTGIGMTREELEQISNRFYQAESGKLVRAGGLGLGLPIVNGFVRALGGFMIVESKPQCGTTVRVSVPQKVADPQRCMSVSDRGQVNLGGFLNIGKFQNPNVREFYNAMILNVVKGLETPMHRVGSVEDLEKLVGQIRLTHLFVGEEEYLSVPDYLESLAKKMSVIMVGHTDAALPPHSHILFLPKPLYGFPIAAILNSAPMTADSDNRRMYCPGVAALVVDDEPMNLHAAAGILRRYGIAVTTAASGAEAIRLCGQESFDIIFMDHMMPEMDGVEAMKRIRRGMEAERWEAPVIALTANALSSAREMFLSEGFDGFVSKPIEIPELERVIRRVLPKSLLTFTEEPLPAGGGRQAQSRNKETPEPQTLQRLKEAGIDTVQGLRNCQGDEELYLSLLRQFVSDHPDKRQRLESCLSRQDVSNYAIIVHALKSTARMIGAHALSDMAKDMEDAAKKGHSAWLTAHHQPLLSEYDAVSASIARCGLSAEWQEDEEEDGEVFEFAPKGGEDS